MVGCAETLPKPFVQVVIKWTLFTNHELHCWLKTASLMFNASDFALFLISFNILTFYKTRADAKQVKLQVETTLKQGWLREEKKCLNQEFWP